MAELISDAGPVGDSASTYPWASVVIALAMGCVFATIMWVASALHPTYDSDWDQVYWGARAVWSGLNPYDVSLIGPDGTMFRFDFPLYYPLPAMLVVSPLAAFPLRVARALWVGISAGVLVYMIEAKAPHLRSLLLSGAFIMAFGAAQWSPLLSASLMLPALGWAVVAKPTIGAALIASTSEPLFLRSALIGGGLLVAVSFAIQPAWLPHWLASVSTAPHLAPPITLFGGVLVLLALTRWRRWEARLLVALACVPHTTVAYEALYLLLIPKTRKQTILLSIASLIALGIQLWLDPRATITATRDVQETAFREYMAIAGRLSVALVYLPALIMVLRRPNEGELPAWWPLLSRPLKVIRG